MRRRRTADLRQSFEEPYEELARPTLAYWTPDHLKHDLESRAASDAAIAAWRLEFDAWRERVRAAGHSPYGCWFGRLGAAGNIWPR